MKIEIHQEGDCASHYRPSRAAMILAFQASQLADTGNDIEVRELTKNWEQLKGVLCVAIYGKEHRETAENVAKGLVGFNVRLHIDRCDKEWNSWSEIYVVSVKKLHVVPTETETESPDEN